MSNNWEQAKRLLDFKSVLNYNFFHMCLHSVIERNKYRTIKKQHKPRRILLQVADRIPSSFEHGKPVYYLKNLLQ